MSIIICQIFFDQKFAIINVILFIIIMFVTVFCPGTRINLI
jgi:hypothetical protein